MADIQVTPFSAGRPGPYVDVLVTGSVPASAVTATVSRMSEGRTFRVRGMVGLPVIGALTARDYEAPFDRNMTYQAQFFNAAGSPVGYSSKASTRMPALFENAAWWHDPLDPSTSVCVIMGKGAAGELSRPVDSEVLRARNRSVGIVIGGTRQGLSKVALNCITQTAEDSARFDALFGRYDDIHVGVVCVRATSAVAIPAVFFANVSAPTRVTFDHLSRDTAGFSTWPIVGDEVAPPAPAIVRALLTHQDFEDFYSSYTEFEAAYSSYLEATRDYSVKG